MNEPVKSPNPILHQPRTMRMNWTIDYLDSSGIICAMVSGDLTADGIKAMQSELLEESKRRNVKRLLCDCRGVSPRINFSEVYELPAKLRELGVTSEHKFALVYTAGSSAESLLTFLDDRSYNVGLFQKAFSDYERACLWLAGMEHKVPMRASVLLH